MKFFLSPFFFFILSCFPVMGQHLQFHSQDRHAVLDKQDPAAFLLDSVGQPVDAYPQYEAGVEALYRLIYKYVNYPEAAFQKNLGSVVEARFMIDAQGKAKLMDMAKEPSEMFRTRIEMAIRNMGRWRPAVVAGKPADMQARITVTFEVQQGEVEGVNGYDNVDGLVQQVRNAQQRALRPVIHFCLPFSYNAYWPGGDQALQAVVDADLPYPDKALSRGESGDVKARFMVDSAGDALDIEVTSDHDVPHLIRAVRSFIRKHHPWHLGASFGIEGPGYAYLVFSFDAPTKTVKVEVK